jgi:hypothetical protein
MVSFSKGSRQCAGTNLSYAELYLALAGIFRRYGVKGIAGGPNGTLELFETTVDDVAMAADMWVPFVKDGSKGVRVWVK